MKKLSIIILLAAAACQKNRPATEAALIETFKASNINCKSCAAYAGTSERNGLIADKETFCKNYCRSLGNPGDTIKIPGR